MDKKMNRIGSYAAVVLHDGLYEIKDIENMEEWDIEELRDYCNNNNQVVIALRNLDDVSKCKPVLGTSRKRKYEELKERYKDDKDFIVI